MSVATVTMRTGFYAEQVSGAGLSDAELLAAQEQRALAQDLELAICDAMANARLTGVSAFEPDSALLVLPNQDEAYRNRVRLLFAELMNTPFTAEDEQFYPDLLPYGSLNLAQWSAAEQQLSAYSARLTSSFAPGDGGVEYARGQWYINGQQYSLADLVLTIRLGNLNGLDSMLQSDLNTMVANTTLARQLMAITGDMKWRRAQQELDVASAITNADQEDTTAIFDPVTDYQNYVDSTGLSSESLAELGLRFKGESSALFYANFQVLQNGTLSEAEYDDTINELQTMFDSINSENDVKRVMIETRQNERTNMLSSMSNFFKGASDIAEEVVRTLHETR
jgi:glutathione S-transferase